MTREQNEDYPVGTIWPKPEWNCKYCGNNDEPKCHKCVRKDGKLITDELEKDIP